MGTKDGGPAFPLATTAETVDYHGMSQRDWFASRAPIPREFDIQFERDMDIEACLEEYEAGRIKHSGQGPIRSRARIIADLAFRHADAMLAAREAT